MHQLAPPFDPSLVHLSTSLSFREGVRRCEYTDGQSDKSGLNHGELLSVLRGLHKGEPRQAIAYSQTFTKIRGLAWFG
jgi:hypothetical protein